MTGLVRKRPLQFFIHFIVWFIIAVFPLIFLYSEGERNIMRYLDFSLPILFLILVFYANYFLIICRYLFRKKVLKYFLANFLLFTVCVILLNFIKEYYFDAYFAKQASMNHFPPRARMKDILLFRDVLSMALTVGLATAIKMTTQWYQSVAEQKELEKLHVESELLNLKHQLNPHFLFNTLNNIYSLISINQDQAQNAVHQLSNLIRYVLYDSEQQLVPLSKDLAFTANYIKLMSLRLPGHVQLVTDIPESGEQTLIAPLLFISLVENAFKHGVSPTEKSFIQIRISQIRPDEIQCLVENSNFPVGGNDKSGQGIGLNNLLKRLNLIYPGRYELTSEIKEGTFYSKLIIKV